MSNHTLLHAAIIAEATLRELFASVQDYEELSDPHANIVQEGDRAALKALQRAIKAAQE